MGNLQLQEARCVLFQHNFKLLAIKYSLAAKCSNKSNIIANEVHVRQNRLIPKFNFMNPRGICNCDMMPLKQTKKAVWSLNHRKSDVPGLNGKPHPNDNGTSNGTMHDQVI